MSPDHILLITSNTDYAERGHLSPIWKVIIISCLAYNSKKIINLLNSHKLCAF